MKRSEVNRVIAAATNTFADCRVHLPPFASWRLEDWREREADALELMEAGLGWDVVEWRPDEFVGHGLLLFTCRNVRRAYPSGSIDGYAEKLMIIRSSQRTPLHTHHRKMEDLINRGGGDIVIELNAERDVERDRYVILNGVKKRIAYDGETVVLRPGESITLMPGVYHAFCASGGDVIAGEVSTYNDDATDNDFAVYTERYPRLEEDEPPERLLVADYPRFIESLRRRPDVPT